MKEFIQEHFAVLLVTAILVALLLVYIVETHTTANDAVINWLQAKISDALSAIFMGLGGPYLNKAVKGEK